MHDRSPARRRDGARGDGLRVLVTALVPVAATLVMLALGARPTEAQATDAAEARRSAEALGWAAGPPDAPVTVIEFTDVSCPYCASFHAGTRAALREEFVESGQVRWITLSYVSGLYPNSGSLAVAAECAGAQGRFEDFMDAAYRDRDAWLRAGDAEVTAAVERFAGQAGLDVTAFAQCLLDATPAERIERVGALARAIGVRGTPTWVVDGFPVMGDLPLGYARQFIATRLPG